MRLAVDTSALIACVFDEPEAQAIEQLIFKSDVFVTAPVLLEATMVLAGRGVTNPIETVSEAEIDYKLMFVPFDERMIRIAQEAFLRYGKGRHPAKLNFGDCMSYALAKALDVPLLYKGDDFAATDIESALALFGGE